MAHVKYLSRMTSHVGTKQLDSRRSVRMSSTFQERPPVRSNVVHYACQVLFKEQGECACRVLSRTMSHVEYLSRTTSQVGSFKKLESCQFSTHVKYFSVHSKEGNKYARCHDTFFSVAMTSCFSSCDDTFFSYDTLFSRYHDTFFSEVKKGPRTTS